MIVKKFEYVGLEALLTRGEYGDPVTFAYSWVDKLFDPRPGEGRVEGWLYAFDSTFGYVVVGIEGDPDFVLVEIREEGEE